MFIFFRVHLKKFVLLLSLMGASILSFFYLFINYIPWLGSEPISYISSYKLNNLPPPNTAKSFAINHGSAIYYTDAIPSEEVLKCALIIFAFIISIIVYVICAKKMAKLLNADVPYL